MPKKRTPDAETYARQQAEKLNKEKAESEAAFRKERGEKRAAALYGEADVRSIHTKFLTADKTEQEKERQIQIMAQQERERQARESAEKGRARKVLVCGDARGNLSKLFATVEAQEKKVGPFDALFCVGSFLPEVAPAAGANVAGIEAASAVVANSDAADAGLAGYLTGEKRVPVECYFVDPGAALVHAAPRGKKIGEKLYFLGAYGVREICGLRVAYLSGHYNPSTYETAGVDFVGGAFTSKAVGTLQRLAKQRGIDVLLTCGWPAGCERHIEAKAQLPPDQSWQLASAPPLAELCLAIEPRYHIFGSGQIFYQRPPFQTPRRGHACRCIGLGQVGSTSKQQKWLHALALSPMEHMKPEDLKQKPAGVTPCPFVVSAKRAADSAELSEMPSTKRSAVAASSTAEESVPEQALASLRTGELSLYWRMVEKLQDVPMNARESSGDSKAAAPKTQAAEQWLRSEPKSGVVRYTYKEEGDIGLHLSKDIPPWVLKVIDGSVSARKAPKVPIGGIVIAVNGYEFIEGDCEEASKALANQTSRPIALDVKWPDDIDPPVVKYG